MNSYRSSSLKAQVVDTEESLGHTSPANKRDITTQKKF